MKAITSLLTLTTCIGLSGCAYMTAVPVTDANRASVQGIRVFSPKPYVVVNATGVSTIVLPDCSQEVAVQFGAVLAKQDVTLKMQNGMLNDLTSNQDSTLFPSNLLTAVTELAKLDAPTGKGSSDKAGGGGVKAFVLLEPNCEDGKLSLGPVGAVANLPAADPPAAPRSISTEESDPEAGTPVPDAEARKPGKTATGDRR